ncbi:MAG: hypothetical protein KIT20_03060 [Alphaproteobacteria bacterium]|nr:hypothetical protein [Alphaproteobacteria bacterium]
MKGTSLLSGAALLLLAACSGGEPREAFDIDDWEGDYRIARSGGDCPMQINILTGALAMGRPGAAALLARHYRDGDCLPRDEAEAARLERL